LAGLTVVTTGAFDDVPAVAGAAVAAAPTAIAAVAISPAIRAAKCLVITASSFVLAALRCASGSVAGCLANHTKTRNRHIIAKR
jgi:hypothetical protein